MDEDIIFGDRCDIPNPDDPCGFEVDEEGEELSTVHDAPRSWRFEHAGEEAPRIRNEEAFARARAYQLRGDDASVD